MPDYSSILSTNNLLEHFPWSQFPDILPNQREALELIAAEGGSLTMELPTGTGKTAIGYTVARAFADAGLGPIYYLVPTKTLVDQVALMHPDMVRAYGRSEYDCLYYEPVIHKADQIPCLTLRDCQHRVDMETGETVGDGADRCPYYDAKFTARNSRLVVCTFAFYLFNNLFRRDYEPPAAMVIDEVHQIAKVFRNALSYDISDWHLRRSIDLLKRIGAESEADQVSQFLSVMVSVLRRKPQDQPTLLKDDEIAVLMDSLGDIDDGALRSRIAQAIAAGEINTVDDRTVLVHLEQLTYSLARYVRSLEYSLPAMGRRAALNYITYAYSDNLPEETGDRVQYRLIVKSYYVVPLIKKLLAPMTLAYSATIGDDVIFGYETGVQQPFVSLSGDFPVDNTRVYMPVDTPNLAQSKRSRQDMTKTLRKMVRMVRDHGQKGIRSLVVVVSEKERQKFLWLANDEGVEVTSYGDGVTPRDAVALFKDGAGVALVGTAAHYGEGVDLPAGMAPVVHVLRPGYPNPSDPLTQYEERRYGGQRWAIWNWRVMIEALQVRGRNIRSASDKGVTIFWSQQFRRFVHACLPDWLKPAYRGEMTLEQVREDVLELLE